MSNKKEREKITPQGHKKGGGKDRQRGEEESPVFSAETAVVPQLIMYEDLVAHMVEQVQ